MRVLTFLFHLAIATLVVPMLAILSGSIIHSVLRQVHLSAASPQEFVSDHLFLIVGASGLWLGYVVCETFTGKYAQWVWIPALIALALRVVMWRSTGSVLFHSSIVEHFFTADCQIQDWHNRWFVSQCADRLLVMQPIIGSFAYSAGSVIYGVAKRRRPSFAATSRNGMDVIL